MLIIAPAVLPKACMKTSKPTQPWEHFIDMSMNIFHPNIKTTHIDVDDDDDHHQNYAANVEHDGHQDYADDNKHADNRR